MMEVQAGPSSHQFYLQSVSGTGAPTFMISGGGSATSGAGGAGGAGGATGGEPFHSLSQANPSSYPGFAPAMTSLRHEPQMSPTTTLEGGVTCKTRKRKADSQDNERLSKRLSLLNLERSGNKLYVPVETPYRRPPNNSSNYNNNNNNTNTPSPDALQNRDRDQGGDDEAMQLDGLDDEDTRHKVYIYDLDDELSSDGESSCTSSDDGGAGARLAFLPDVEKHLLRSRIPPSVLRAGGGVGGEGRPPAAAGMQLVLYREPAALTVPEERDGVRRAVIEARHRLRERQRQGDECAGAADADADADADGDRDANAAAAAGSVPAAGTSSSSPTPSPSPSPSPAPPLDSGYYRHYYGDLGQNGNVNDDPDAMEMD